MYETQPQTTNYVLLDFDCEQESQDTEIEQLRDWYNSQQTT